jgi:hypothetical protein
MRLGIGNELKRVALNPEFPYKLASVEEVQALAGVSTTRIAKKTIPLKKHNPATKMLARAVGYSPTKKKILLKRKKRPLNQAGLLSIRPLSIPFLFSP